MKHTISGQLNESVFVEQIRLFAEEKGFTFLGAGIDLGKFTYSCGIAIGKTKYLLELNNGRHYANARVMYNDSQKGSTAIENGYVLSRLPYWLQLDTDTLAWLFPQESFPLHEIETDFPHGFVPTDSTILNPSSFCGLGMQRYEREFSELTFTTQISVLASLQYQADVLGIPMKYVGGDIDLSSITQQPAFKAAYNRLADYCHEEAAASA
jgi:hypothetical protein